MSVDDVLKNVFSSSYNTSSIENFITSFVQIIDPATVVEIGTQQGKSTILIARGLSDTATLWSFDRFEPNYDSGPMLATHSNKSNAERNVELCDFKCSVFIEKSDGVDAINRFESVDMLHVDICNHYENLKPILALANDVVKKAIILEGGRTNNWQKKHGFRPYTDLLNESPFCNTWDHVTVPINEHNAVTILTRKQEASNG